MTVFIFSVVLLAVLGILIGILLGVAGKAVSYTHLTLPTKLEV